MKVKELFVEAMKRDKNFQDEFLETFEEALGEDAMEGTFEKLYKCLYGSHFIEPLAYEAVHGMYGMDSKGETYPKETTDDVAKKLGLTFENYNEWDWYFTINMIASDYKGVVDPANYAKIAKAWLEDKDVANGKAFRYWWKVVKCKN